MYKVKSKLKNQKAITLISLIVTIVILIILAGIIISMTVGSNGIITRAREARNLYINAQEEEQVKLNALAEQLTNGETGSDENKLPENTKDTEAGTEVALEPGWGTENVSYIRTKDGSEVKNVTKVSTVYAVSVGEGNTVPVPKEFYYVGGTLTSGVVISDNIADKNKYAGIEDVPAGVIYNSDGTVKQEANLTDEEKKTVILGNQFVWIPCEASEYKKIDWGKASTTWETQTNTAELTQIQKYGGFYIGRYEAGTSNITLSTGINFAVQNTVSYWSNDNFSIRDGLNHTVTGTITTKAGEIPYYHVDYETATKLSSSMYNTNYVNSGLITGTMWDIMMKFIANGDNTIVTNGTWGNHYNTGSNVKYTAGIGRYSAIIDNGSTSNFQVSNGNYYYGIRTSASSEDVKKKNIYDAAGNLWEWTMEASYHKNALESYILRGGSFFHTSSDTSPIARSNQTATITFTYLGFRPALYIK